MAGVFLFHFHSREGFARAEDSQDLALDLRNFSSFLLSQCISISRRSFICRSINLRFSIWGFNAIRHSFLRFVLHAFAITVTVRASAIFLPTQLLKRET